MHKNSSIFFSFFLLISDFVAVLTAFVVAYIIRVKYDPRHLLEQISARDYLASILLIVPIWLLVHAYIGLYSKSIYANRWSELYRVLVGSFLGILVVIGADFISAGNFFPARLVVVYAFILAFIFLLFSRLIARILFARIRLKQGGIKVLLICDARTSKHLINALFNDKSYKIIGVVGNSQYVPKKIPVYSSLAAADTEIGEQLSSIVQTQLFTNENKNTEILEYAQTHHLAYQVIPGNNDIFSGNIDIEILSGMPVIAVHPTSLLGWGRVIKRLFDIFTSLLLLIVAAPIIFVISFLLKIIDFRAPIFFTQTRLTRFNREFKVFKFRSQYQQFDGTTPEEAFHMMGKPELAKQYRANGDYLKNDPRITPLGRFLRESSLDELPQLWNVLRGDISLVGPRALIPSELNQYQKKHTILSVKSGVTGLAQVSGRKDISYEERRALDLFYVQNWSFILDMQILIRTIRAVIRRSGAK